MSTVSPKLLRAQSCFEKVRQAQENFVHSLPSFQNRAGGRCVNISSRQQETLCEMAFVVLFTAWEHFLESAFEAFVIDAPLASFRRRHRVLVVDVETVHDLIRGQRNYADWADQLLVRDRAKVFFNGGEPFESALSSVAEDLRRMRTIRNRCVHYSKHAKKQYENFVRQVFGSGRLITPGRLLLNAPPTGLSTVAGATNYSSVFILYSEVLSTASCQIVPGRRR